MSGKRTKVRQKLSEVCPNSEWSSFNTMGDMFWKSEQRRFETKLFAASSSNKNTLIIKINLCLFFKNRRTLSKIWGSSSKCFYQSSSAELAEASFEISHMIAKEKKSHNRSCEKQPVWYWGGEQQKACKDFSCWFYHWNTHRWAPKEG